MLHKWSKFGVENMISAINNNTDGLIIYSSRKYRVK